MMAFHGGIARSSGQRPTTALLALCLCAIATLRATAQAVPPPPSATQPSATPSSAAPPSTAPAASAQPISSPSANPVIAPPAAPSSPSTGDAEFAFSGLSDITAPSNGDAPYMIGDFFVGSGQIVFAGKESANVRPGLVGQIPSAGGSGRAKISDDNSVFPEDRVFFFYNYFDNAILIPSPSEHTLDVNRFTPGFEKTFWDRQASVELRIPFANTQSSDVYLLGGKDQDTEFGNLELTLKFLLCKGDYFSAAAGVGFNVPTASDVRVFDGGLNSPIFTIANDAFHVQPYAGLLYTPNDRLFVQTFVEFDLDATANEVKRPGKGDVGNLYDQDLLLVDLQAGVWLWRNPQAQFVTGLAPTIEFHYTTTIQNASFITVPTPGGPYVLGNTANRLDIRNLTLGVQILLGRSSTLNIAGVVPLDKPTSDNRQFDSEFFVQFNRFF
jgi:hypothetical protein